VKGMQNRKSNHVIPGANAAKAQGMGAGYNEEMGEMSNEPLSIKEKMNNKKRKKNQ
jgi:small acid-soluble spore protein O (minor)